ncbi:MAG: 30S ribosomal protein S13 [Candidatus Woykebacteria bacterium RBG_16_44_10]|uniref:Small ribosomal subunit protein uS13 n=1 Tax=Candidatus Woykebacteria bacterium RBG_16_44_10 TaxID=1802597 RepID=A0A1G1WEC3_9BACT|nr:MAG: 30S ribosomal protein S13 [Candidatus Woykebacteria bacterium RBG_16_44_10]
MARIAGIELPINRKIIYALPIIYGIGSSLSQKIIETSKVSGDKRVKDLSEEEVSKLQKEVDKYTVEGDLRRLIAQDIRRLEEIGSYRGTRHRRGLPARGQRTRSNARTKRGKRQTIGAMRKELRTKVTQKGTGEEKQG